MKMMKVTISLFLCSAAYSLPTPPSFLKPVQLTETHKKVKSWGLFRGSETSWEERPLLERHPKLKGVHKDLQKIIEIASQNVSLIVFEGCRTLKKQKEYVKAGKSKTLRSRHLKCAAIDVVFKQDTGKVKWTWEQAVATVKYLRGIGAALGIRCLRDGSSWDNGLDVTNTRFKDAFHLEIQRNCHG